jgi:hypothetical protein
MQEISLLQKERVLWVKMALVWAMMTCSLVEVPWRFGETCHLHRHRVLRQKCVDVSREPAASIKAVYSASSATLSGGTCCRHPDDENSNYTASHPRRQQSLHSPPWEPQISHSSRFSLQTNHSAKTKDQQEILKCKRWNCRLCIRASFAVLGEQRNGKNRPPSSDPMLRFIVVFSKQIQGHLQTGHWSFQLHYSLPSKHRYYTIFSVTGNIINLLKPSGNFTYHQV